MSTIETFPTADPGKQYSRIQLKHVNMGGMLRQVFLFLENCSLTHNVSAALIVKFMLLGDQVHHYTGATVKFNIISWLSHIIS